VNFSGRQLLDTDVVADVSGALVESGARARTAGIASFVGRLAARSTCSGLLDICLVRSLHSAFYRIERDASAARGSGGRHGTIVVGEGVEGMRGRRPCRGGDELRGATASDAAPAAAVVAAALPAGFEETVAISGLEFPEAFAFSPDGRIFVAEKNGLIKVFDSLADPVPDRFADLRTNVHGFWDRGMSGIALDPAFPTRPFVYVAYTYDAPPGGVAPRWGDACPTPPGATTDGCVVTARVSRLEAAGNKMTGAERVLIHDWCQQFPSHSIGDLAFGPDGALYVTGGDGAAFGSIDWGQWGGSAGSPTPRNPCADPPGGIGAQLSPPTAQGGSLRAQDLRTGGDPATLDGTLIRIDPATGAGLPDNPGAASTDANVRRILAYGFRNPFRLAFPPGTGEVWVGDVGDGRWEEINRIPSPASSVRNFGWPCYEGAARHPAWDFNDLDVCEALYAEGSALAPYFAYPHNLDPVVPGDTCPGNQASTTGLAFYEGGSYPAAYAGALFFADYTRDCIWVMKRGANGLPDPALREPFLPGAANPVDLQIGPAGDLFYLDFQGGTLRRVAFSGGNRSPVAVATATPAGGPVPLTVAFEGAGSSDPDGDALRYEWDLDGDGAFDDAATPRATWTYTAPGNTSARLRVTDPAGGDGSRRRRRERRQHAAARDNRRAGGVDDVGGGPGDHLRRRRRRRGGGRAERGVASLVAHPASLRHGDGVPHASGRGAVRRRRGQLRGPGSRVSRVPRAASHRH
jgi:glucose/arabinose dehydrogenase